MSAQRDPACTGVALDSINPDQEAGRGPDLNGQADPGCYEPTKSKRVTNSTGTVVVFRPSPYLS